MDQNEVNHILVINSVILAPDGAGGGLLTSGS